MSTRKDWLYVSMVLLLGASRMAAQDAGNSHVFPQIVDGRQADGYYYTSLLWITDVGATATCTLSLFGLDEDRVHPSTTITVPGNGWAVVSTDGQRPLAAGYARLDCSQPVTASLTYSLFAPAGARVGMATVFPALLVARAVHPLLLDGNLRYGVAIANDADAPASIFLEYDDLPPGNRTDIKMIQIPPHSRYTGFVDEILTLPAQGSGQFEITALGVGASGFRPTVLLFDHQVFTTLVPATVR